MTNLHEYEKKLIMVVNSATHCGLTPQYTELEDIYQEFNDQDFIILDFPCNQFGKQAPEEIDELHDFCVMNNDISFPQFNKIDVNGANADPLFTFLKSETGNKKLKWNFTKFLISRDEKVVKRYNPMKKTRKIKDDIANLL